MVERIRWLLWGLRRERRGERPCKQVRFQGPSARTVKGDRASTRRCRWCRTS